MRRANLAGRRSSNKGVGVRCLVDEAGVTVSAEHEDEGVLASGEGVEELEVDVVVFGAGRRRACR
jgi:hypothetical protein